MRKVLKMPAGALLLIVPLLLSGCGLWGESSKEIDPPQDENYVEEGQSLDQESKKGKQEGESSSKTSEESAKTIATELYLFDKNGLVVPQTLMLPKTVGTAKQSLQYLVKDGPVTPLLPNDFQAVLPSGTQVLGVNIDDNGTLTVNFSNEFKNYQPANEEKILEAVTWTATQFESVDNVKIQIEGVAQEVMPVNNTPIGEDGINRAAGINNQAGNVVDITGTNGITVYYPAQAADHYYYVPVTKRVNAPEGDVAAVVESLVQGPVAHAGLLDEFGKQIKLLSEPSVKDEVVTLNFNEGIYSSNEKKVISQEALQSLVLSLTAQEGIEKVSIQVDGKTTLKNEKGEEITKPVSRPEQVNTVGL